MSTTSTAPERTVFADVEKALADKSNVSETTGNNTVELSLAAALAAAKDGVIGISRNNSNRSQFPLNATGRIVLSSADAKKNTLLITGTSGSGRQWSVNLLTDLTAVIDDLSNVSKDDNPKNIKEGKEVSSESISLSEDLFGLYPEFADVTQWDSLEIHVKAEYLYTPEQMESKRAQAKEGETVSNRIVLVPFIPEED